MAGSLFRKVVKIGLDPEVKPVNFFIPHTKPSAYVATLEAMIAEIKYQFSWPVTDRRIMSITYRQERKVVTATVGKIEQLEKHYEVVAIFEASLYMIVTRSASGAIGPTILVNSQEVIRVVDFKPSAPNRQPLPTAATG